MHSERLDPNGLLYDFMSLYAPELFTGVDAQGLGTGALNEGALLGSIGLDRVSLWAGLLAEASSCHTEWACFGA